MPGTSMMIIADVQKMVWAILFWGSRIWWPESWKYSSAALTFKSDFSILIKECQIFAGNLVNIHTSHHVELHQEDSLQLRRSDSVDFLPDEDSQLANSFAESSSYFCPLWLRVTRLIAIWVFGQAVDIGFNARTFFTNETKIAAGPVTTETGKQYRWSHKCPLHNTRKTNPGT